MDVMESLEIWWELNTPYTANASCHVTHAAIRVHRLLFANYLSSVSS